MNKEQQSRLEYLHARKKLINFLLVNMLANNRNDLEEFDTHSTEKERMGHYLEMFKVYYPDDYEECLTVIILGLDDKGIEIPHEVIQSIKKN